MKNRNQYIYFITLNNNKKKFLSTETKIDTYTKNTLKKITKEIKCIKKEHHFEKDKYINGNPTTLILKLPNKKNKGIYTYRCNNCKTYIKNARNTEINPNHGKCPLCRKDFPNILRESYGTN